MLISNHTFWDKAPPYFQDLCREWSGKQDPFENHINTLKSISFSRKIALHVNLLHTDGTLLLRDELVKTFYRLRDAHAEKITKISGIVLDGNPGIGKSAANLLFLIGCLAYQQPVFFTPRSGAIYYFSGLSVWKFKGPGSMINLEHILELEFPGDVRPWSLIDINTSPPDALVCSELFPIQTVSLNPEHYQTWKKANTARMWIMQVWKEEDLEDFLNMNQDLPFRSWSDEDKSKFLAEARWFCAPTPRDYHEFAVDKAEYINIAQDSAISIDLRSPKTMILDHVKLDINDTTHRLFVVERVSRGAVWTSDVYNILFKSPHVEDVLADRYEQLSVNETHRLLKVCSGVSEASALARWAFGKLLFRYTSGEVTADYKFAPLKDMTALPGSFIYSDSSLASTPSHLIVSSGGHSLTPDYRSIFSLAAAPSFGRNGHGIFSSAFGRSRIYYDRIDSELITIAQNRHYIPNKRTNSLVDSFFFVPSQTRIEIWVLRMTAYKRPEGSATGYDEVYEIWKIASAVAAGREVLVNYVLVVPLKRYKVSWNMSQGWGEKKETQGNVYVQYLDIESA